MEVSGYLDTSAALPPGMNAWNRSLGGPSAGLNVYMPHALTILLNTPNNI